VGGWASGTAVEKRNGRCTDGLQHCSAGSLAFCLFEGGPAQASAAHVFDCLRPPNHRVMDGRFCCVMQKGVPGDDARPARRHVYAVVVSRATRAKVPSSAPPCGLPRLAGGPRGAVTGAVLGAWQGGAVQHPPPPPPPDGRDGTRCRHVASPPRLALSGRHGRVGRVRKGALSVCHAITAVIGRP